MYPNGVNMIAVPITKSTMIIMRIQVWLISWKNFDYKKNGEKNLLLLNQSINIVYPNKETMIVVPNNSKNKDYYEYPCSSYFTDGH